MDRKEDIKREEAASEAATSESTIAKTPTKKKSSVIGVGHNGCRFFRV